MVIDFDIEKWSSIGAAVKVLINLMGEQVNDKADFEEVAYKFYEIALRYQDPNDLAKLSKERQVHMYWLIYEGCIEIEKLVSKQIEAH